MNKIYQLLDPEFVRALFKANVLKHYPDLADIKQIKVIKHKDKIWEKTYHVVIEYKTTFATKDGKRKCFSIFCTAHSDEPRRNVFDSMKFLWDGGFAKGYNTIPRPLFYSEEFQGTFYRGAHGDTLYKFIREGDRKTIEDMVPKAARWFAKLHSLKTLKARNFNEENSRIATVIPGVEHILKRISERYPEHLEAYRESYGRFIKEEEEYFASTDRRCLVHGDAHPENVIRMGEHKIAIIDFTDICLSDHARDVGTFSQQLEFMISRKLDDPAYGAKMVALFRDSYFAAAKHSPSTDLEARIQRYYHWTAMRTATLFLLQEHPEPERAEPLILMSKKWLEQ